VTVLPVVRVLAPNPDVYTLEGTNTWIVGDGVSVVIDPGPEIPSHLDEVARQAGRIAAVLVTHDHPDHAPGATAFAQRVGAPVYAFRLPGARHLRDGEVIEGGGVAITAVHAPGHSPDHVVFHVPAEGALFTGDAVLGRGTSVIDPPEGDLARYLRSLHRMQELAPRTIYPGHGPVVMHAAATLQQYVDHRAEREAQVVAALEDGPRPVAELVETIYAGYPLEVRPLAARSVLAHLLKLEAEGRVARSGHGEEAAWSAVAPRVCRRCGREVRGRALYCPTCTLVILQEGASAAAEPSAAEPSAEEPSAEEEPARADPEA
jgi:glyoxylase-like metal-dependent hydrolase (beta-lactamase superfamily II)